MGTSASFASEGFRKRNQIHALYNPVPFHENVCALVPETEESHGAGCGQTRKV